MTGSDPIDAWLRIANEDDDFAPGIDGYHNAEANTYLSDDGYRVEWYLRAVGLVRAVEFDTLADAYDWLEQERFENYTAEPSSTEGEREA